VPAGLRCRPLGAKHAAVAEAPAGMFTTNHAELAGLDPDQIAFLDARSPG
jgi:hypothetical protein